jgi:hypothetical protein
MPPGNGLPAQLDIAAAGDEVIPVLAAFPEFIQAE